MNGLHYSIRPDKSYFMTLTVFDWIDVFTRLNHKMLLVDSLKYCQREKGLNIFAWCLMPSHLHLIANTSVKFELAGRFNKKIKNFKFWQDGNHAIEVYSEHVTWQKINYIHLNPVAEKIVYREEDYLFSSARNYYDLPAVLDINCITPPVLTAGMPGFYRVRFD